MGVALLTESGFAPFEEETGFGECRRADEMVSFYRKEYGQAPLLVVTNREPIVWEKGGGYALPPGGVSQTIHRLLGQIGGEWIALRDSAGPDLIRVPAFKEGRGGSGYLLRRMSLPDPLRHAHYAGFSNGVLWPFFHSDPSRIDRSQDFYPAYFRVNRRMAGQIMESLTECPAGAVWIHDYQLALVAREVRQMSGDDCPPMAFFWHIPWNEGITEDTVKDHPWLRDLVDGLLSHDHVGFQTELYRTLFVDTVRLLHGENASWDGEVLRISTLQGYRTVSLGVHPISIDPEHFDRLSRDSVGMEEAQSILREADLLDEQGSIRPFLISVERMDYSKGFLERMAILESLYEQYPERIGTISLLQVAPPSRQNVEAYQSYARRVQEAERRLNVRFSRKGWTPVRTIARALGQSVLAPLYRSASGALITATKDGMNLVAKEFLASQIGRDGILFLSRHTGAAQTMEGLSLIDPFNPTLSAKLIHQGLSLERAVRRIRNARAQTDLAKNNVYFWTAQNFAALRRVSTLTAR